MCPCFSHACPSAVKQLPWYVALSFRRLFECYKANPGSGRSCSECARGEWHQTTRARTLFSGGSTETSGYLSGWSGKSTVLVTERLTLPLITSPHSCPFTTQVNTSLVPGLFLWRMGKTEKGMGMRLSWRLIECWLLLLILTLVIAILRGQLRVNLVFGLIVFELRFLSLFLLTMNKHYSA